MNDPLIFFWFCQICFMCWFLQHGAKSKLVFFVNVLWFTISSWNFFLICDITNLIYVIIHVVKKFRTSHCQKCGKYLKKRKKNHRTHAKDNMFFSPSSSWMFNIFNNHLKYQKFPKNSMVFKNCILSHENVKQQALTMKDFLFRQKHFFCENCFYSDYNN